MSADNKKEKQPARRRCKAKSKRSGKQCRNYPVQGYEVCRMHGANPHNRGGAPKGNKNRLTTGEHETIHYDTLDDQEKKLWARIRTDVTTQLDEEIRLITIRERRMMQRIGWLRDVTMTVVEETEEVGGEEIRPVNEDYGTGEVVVNEKKVTQKRRGTLGQIQHIEEALTRVQAQKARLLDLKHRIESGADGDEHPDLAGYEAALKGAAEDAWGDE